MPDTISLGFEIHTIHRLHANHNIGARGPQVDKKGGATMIRMPDTETALRIYYSNANEIGSREIRELFKLSANSGATVARIKKTVWAEQEKRGIKTWNAGSIDTETAYEVWGLDIRKLERNYKKMKALGLAECIQDPGKEEIPCEN